MTKWMMVACGLLVGVVVSAAPKLEATPAVAELGVIKDRSNPVPMEFQLKNVGDGVLQIIEVKPGCGCTGAEIDRDELKAGEVAVVKASFKPGSFEGDIRKTITVKTNDPDKPTSFLSFHAKLPFTDEGLRLTPKFKEFRAYPWKEGLRVQIGIQNCDAIGSANVLAIDLPDGWQLDTTSRLPAEVKPEQRQFFYFVNPNADRDVEFHDAKVVFRTDHPSFATMEAAIGFRPPNPKK